MVGTTITIRRHASLRRTRLMATQYGVHISSPDMRAASMADPTSLHNAVDVSRDAQLSSIDGSFAAARGADDLAYEILPDADLRLDCAIRQPMESDGDHFLTYSLNKDDDAAEQVKSLRTDPRGVGAMQDEEDGLLNMVLLAFSWIWIPTLAVFGAPESQDRYGGQTSAYTDSLPPRGNLQVLPNSTAARTLFSDDMGNGCGLTASAVDYAVSPTSTGYTVGVGNKAGGALRSPTILIRSGIGPKNAIQMGGIRAELNLPGVGQHLHDHLADSDVTTLLSQTDYSSLGLAPLQRIR
ncbi:hypothetical protein EI94DRAFT_1785719 [Lactarius quietus]|nr:hypothetical protein EI94DRAFT_1785719 [Lactarius quietus]